jgi:hypothetical protein
MTERESREGEQAQRLPRVTAGPGPVLQAGTIHADFSSEGVPVELDDADYEEVREAIGRGAPTLLLGTSTRSLERSFSKLKGLAHDKSTSSSDDPSVSLTPSPDRALAEKSAPATRPEGEIPAGIKDIARNARMDARVLWELEPVRQLWDTTYNRVEARRSVELFAYAFARQEHSAWRRKRRA